MILIKRITVGKSAYSCPGCSVVRVYQNSKVPKTCLECNKKLRAAAANPDPVWGRNVYKRWASMLQRCNNPNNPNYHRYGGRGIKVCEEWEDHKVFIDWAMANGYSDDLSIDRIDNDKGYSPDNCRFADVMTQRHNTCLLNAANTTGYVGVSKDGNRYCAEVEHLGVCHRVGSHATAVLAAKARDQFIVNNGFPHQLNFPDTKPNGPAGPYVPPPKPPKPPKPVFVQKPGATGYFGVEKEKSRKGFRPHVKVNGKTIRFGTFATAEEAARVREDYIISNQVEGKLMNFTTN